MRILSRFHDCAREGGGKRSYLALAIRYGYFRLSERDSGKLCFESGNVFIDGTRFHIPIGSACAHRSSRERKSFKIHQAQRAILLASVRKEKGSEVLRND